MRIAVFHNLSSGGAKRALYNFVKCLTSSGHLVDVFVPSTADETFLPLNEVANKVNIFPVKRTLTGLTYSTLFYTPPVGIPLRDLERTEKEIADSINKGDYDVVLSEQDQYTMSPFFLKFTKKPTVYYCQQPFGHNRVIALEKNKVYPLKDRLSRILWHNIFASRLEKIDKKNASFSRYILTNSYFSRESILRIYGLNSFVSYLGVDTSIFKPSSIPREDMVLSVGSCTPNKGFDFIIDSLGHIKPEIRPKFIIVSNIIDANWKEHLKKMAKKLKIEMEIKSLIQDDELALLYNKAKLVLYAPYLEPFGLVPLEAMASGTPVVAVKEGGVRETIIHNKTGVLTERDEEIFAQAVSKLLIDDEKREKMVKGCIRVVHNRWTLEHAKERLLKHLNRVMEAEK